MKEGERDLEREREKESSQIQRFMQLVTMASADGWFSSPCMGLAGFSVGDHVRIFSIRTR